MLCIVFRFAKIHTKERPDICFDTRPLFYLAVFLRQKGLTIGTLAHCGVRFMGSHHDRIQSAIIFGLAMVLALFHTAFDATVGMTLIHSGSLLFWFLHKRTAVKTTKPTLPFLRRPCLLLHPCYWIIQRKSFPVFHSEKQKEKPCGPKRAAFLWKGGCFYPFKR